MGPYAPIQGGGPPSSPRATMMHRIHTRWWLWELFGATFTMISFLALIIVLRIFDGQPIPDIPLGISLNTIASILGAIVKTTLLLVVTSALSQMKWLWFYQRPRKLQDLQMFDEASRGPYGALVMLRHSGISMATVGALIILLSLGFDPFVQQLITTPQRMLSSSANSTAIRRASVFDQSAQIEAANTPNNANLRLSGINPISAINVAISNGANSGTQLPDFTPFCPTANCTWPVFPSIGMCATCKNVTDFARKNFQCNDAQVGINNLTRACTYNLPNSNFNYTYRVFNNSNGSYHEVGGELRQRVWSTVLNTTTFSNNSFLLMSRVAMEDNGILLSSPEREQVREATECALSMCVVNHNLTVEHGVTVYSVQSIEEPFATNPIPGPSRIATAIYDVKPATVNGTTYAVEGNNTLFTLATALRSALEGNVTADYINMTRPGAAPQLDGGVAPTTDLSSSFYSGLNFTGAMENTARAVSQYMRSLSNDTTVGDAHTLETYIRVKWPWISFSAFLIAGGLLLLAWAILQTDRSGIEVWKYSSLPLLFNGLEPVGAGYKLKRQTTNTIAEMESEAEMIKVKLGRSNTSGRNWKLLPAQQSEYELGRS